MGFVEVSREDFRKFVDAYPSQLSFDCTAICEPPLATYNDFSGGKAWPNSVVAKEVREWMGPSGETNTDMPGKFWRYYIKD